MIIIDRTKHLQKPRVGETCNKCGLCCKISICDLGFEVLGAIAAERGYYLLDGNCPALTHMQDGTYQCGIVLNPKEYFSCDTNFEKYPENLLSSTARTIIEVGTGCDQTNCEQMGTTPELWEIDACRAMKSNLNADAAYQQKLRQAYELLSEILYSTK